MRSHRLAVGMIVLALLSIILGGAINASDAPKVAATEPVAHGPFDPDPKHPWNRLFLAFFVRDIEYPDRRSHKSPELTPGRLGPEVLDPPLGLHPKFLLDDEPFANCNAALDEFLNKRADRMINDPLKRAVMQHDLWAVFDLLQTEHEDFMRNYGQNPKPYTPAQNERRVVLARKIAQAMVSLALSREQLEKLPDTYAAAVGSGQFPNTVADQAKADYLPPDLFDEKGPWVEVSRKSGLFQHTIIVRGRSVFRVFLGPPVELDGVKHFTEWLAGMRRALEPTTNSDGNDRLSAATEQVPVGTRLLLLRQMACIDDQQEVVPIRVVESVQLRVYRTPHSREILQSQLFEEFEMNRSLLFSNRQGGLRPTPGGEPHAFGYTALGRLAADENGRILALSPFPQNCLACHVGSKREHLRREDEPADYEPQILSIAQSMTFSRPAESKIAAQVARWKSEQKEFNRLIELMNGR